MMIACGLVCLGLLCVYIEFFLPGGLMAVGGMILLLLAFVTFLGQDLSWIYQVGFLISELLLTALVCRLALWHIQKNKKKNLFYLDQNQEGYTACAYDTTLIGKEGVTATDLKPSGHIKVDKKRVQAISEAGYLSPNTPIYVVRGQGAHLIVKPLNQK